MKNILITKRQFKKVVNESIKKLINENEDEERNEYLSYIKQVVDDEGGSIYVNLEDDKMTIGALTSDGFYYIMKDPMKYHEDLESADLQRALWAYVNKHKNAEKYINDIKNILDREKPERLGNYDEEYFVSYDEVNTDTLADIYDYLSRYL